jgi:membrane protein
VGFEIFKQVATIYLRSVLHGPAGATFGPVLGLMVFAYITARLILYATAWAATSAESLAAAPVSPPAPAVIHTRVLDRAGLRVGEVLAAVAVGVLAGLGLSRIRHR